MVNGPALSEGPRQTTLATRITRGAAQVGATVRAQLAERRPRRLRQHLHALESELEALRLDTGILRTRVQGLRNEVVVLRGTQERETQTTGELVEASRRAAEHLDSVGEDLRRVHDVGKVLSSAHGLAGAADGMGQLIYVMNDLRRTVRDLGQADLRTGGPGLDAAVAVTAADPYAGRHPRLFDYLGFERRFRGSVEDVTRTLIERYADELETRGPVLDLGCGRGELLAELSRRGTEVVGVEPHQPSAAEARSRGLTVHTTTASEFLRQQPPHTFGAIVTLQVVEHLVMDDVIEMLELSAKALRPGGLFIAETPNPATMLTMHESYILDPTHVQPIHPALLTFLAERSGFDRNHVRYHAPASTLWFDHVSSDVDPDLADHINSIIDRLNHQLYGPQDFAVWAYTPVTLPAEPEEPHPTPESEPEADVAVEVDRAE